MNRRGLELTVTVIVLLIISVLIFILAVSFLWDWFGKAETLKAEIDRQTEEQIMASLRQGNMLVSVPINVKQTGRGDAVVFGVGVRNAGSQRSFGGVLSFSGAFLPDGQRNPDVDQGYIEEYWLGNFRTIPAFSLKRNEQKVLPVLIKADNKVSVQRATEKGDYVFNLCIFDGPPADYCDPSLLDQDVVYSDRVYQVTVRVQ